jgi:Dolichyl-phosphate-mannose-protein mannosyltransferase
MPDALAVPTPTLSRRLVLIVFVALALRLIAVGFLYPERLNPDRDHWRFGGESGRIARSLVEGKGYSNPMLGETGPTAWMPPVYPSLIALSFRLFGVYSRAALIFMLSLNSLFSALTCLPVFFMARRSFGEAAAVRAAWAWAFFPYGIYFPADFVWPTILTTFLLPLAFAVGLKLKDSSRLGPWIGFGLISGIAAMNDPIVVSVLPLLGLWMWYRKWRDGGRWLLPGAAAALAFLIVVSPWFVRNYRTFHTIIPFRDNFGLELYTGNNGETSQWNAGYLHPANNEREWQEYVKLGEVRYMRRKQDQALEYISHHREQFLWMASRRALYMWTNYWSFNPDYLKEEPFDVPAVFLCTTLTTLSLSGLWMGWRSISSAVIPYAIALFFFPIIYYVSHPEDYFRRPADPLFVVLGAYAVTALLERQKSLARDRRLGLREDEPVTTEDELVPVASRTMAPLTVEDGAS